MSKKALIFGITGQDGFYLTELLLKKKYVVHGVKRRSSSINTKRIDRFYQEPYVKKRNFFLHYGDVVDFPSIIKLIKDIKCKHIFGLTGSLPENKFDIWTINRIFGSIIYQLKSIDLRNENYISNVRVVSLEIQYRNVPSFTVATMSNPTAGYEEETTWLQTSQYRNGLIAKLINKLETNTLILVDRIAHGEHLLSFLKEQTNKDIYFVQGSVEVEERENIKQLMEKTNGVVCIAISKIFSTGISIKNLHNIVFAAIGKARIKIIQSIGRSLRLHHTKEIATIFDIADVSLMYGRKHFEERKLLYISENIPLISSKLVED
jgi:superfamily II DNA or RNA helicase